MMVLESIFSSISRGTRQQCLSKVHRNGEKENLIAGDWPVAEETAMYQERNIPRSLATATLRGRRITFC